MKGRLLKKEKALIEISFSVIHPTEWCVQHGRLFQAFEQPLWRGALVTKAWSFVDEGRKQKFLKK